MTAKGTYHHGNLRQALLEASIRAVAEGGASSVSMSDAARRAGVSSAAPYRHFANRQALLLATAVVTARSLAERLSSLRPAADQLTDTDAAIETLARDAAVYTRFYLEHGAGLDLIYLAELRDLRDPELAEEGRRVMDCMLPAATEISGSPEAAIVLLEQVFAVAHGYAQLHAVSLSPRRLTDQSEVAEAAAETVRLVAGRTADLVAHRERG